MSKAPTVLEAFDFLDRHSDSLRAYEAIPSELVSISQSVNSLELSLRHLYARTTLSRARSDWSHSHTTLLTPWPVIIKNTSSIMLPDQQAEIHTPPFAVYHSASHSSVLPLCFKAMVKPPLTRFLVGR